MSESFAAASSRRRSGTLRALILGVLLATPIILGLLSMHVLGMHAMTAPSMTSQSMPSQSMPEQSMPAMDMAAPHSTMPMTDHRGEALDALDTLGATGAMAMACPNCSVGDPMTMAIACTLALLFVALALALPRLLPRWLHRPAPARFDRRSPEAANSTGSAPSLTALCISRT